ncbi:MAG TPA: glycoside hydrolase family 88 protein [Candidatus Didemnitutus sp.]|nr:glycoside hydrolase family 88 protein [Candidatus Didemnitutus sp.]
MKSIRLVGLVAALSWLGSPAAEVPAFAGATPRQWSERLAHSEMTRLGDSLAAGHDKARWDYSPAVFALALERLSEATGDQSYRDYALQAVGSHVGPDGRIANFRADDYNLDMINAGKVLLDELARKPDEHYLEAVRSLRKQLAGQPRTSEGGFWHKKRYPHQMWLDGVYMASPFLAQYGAMYHEPADLDDVCRQILIIDEHLYDSKTGLYWHAWDEAHTQSWADPKTGVSPNFWSRSIGWYVMAIVDVLDFLPVSHPDVDRVVAVLDKAAAGLVRWQDPKTGVWWNVTDQGSRQGNYLESSGSAMFVYAMAKAINKGYLPRDKYESAVRRGYAGLLHEFIRENPDHTIRLTSVIQGAGLGYTNSAGRARDGTFDYYNGEAVVDNDPKGTGAFILAGIEVEKMLASPSATVRVTGWSSLPALLARIHAPEFPARDFPITDFGAKPGVDATEAVRTAIEACAKAGGGRVIVPAGEWLTGAVRLRSHVNLHLDKGATLKFSTDPAAYPNVYTRWEGVECMNYSALIYAFEETDVAVTGEGTLDGQASDANWWGWTKRGTARDRADRDHLNEMGEKGVPVAERVFGAGHYLRPNFIQSYRCRNVLIEGVHIVRSPMWEIHPTLSTNVIVRDVHIDSRGPNNDGCDPESAQDVLIDHCVFVTGDDCIAIKSGRNNDGRRVNVPTENVIVRGCLMSDGHGGVSIGSEVAGDVRNVFTEDCTMDSPELDRALRIKSNARRGGVVENVFFRNVKVGRVTEAVVTVDLLYEEGARGDHPPVVRNVQLDHVTSTSSPRVLWIAGFPAATIDNIQLTDCTFSGVTATDLVSGAGHIGFDHVTITPEHPAHSHHSPSVDQPANANPAHS